MLISAPPSLKREDAMRDAFAGTESFAPAPPASTMTSRSAASGSYPTLPYTPIAGAMVPTHVSQYHPFPPVRQREQVPGAGNSLLANLRDNAYVPFSSGVQPTSTVAAAYAQKLEAINAILDAEVNFYCQSTTPPLLRTMKISQQFDRLAQIVHFAAHPSQVLVSWRACKAHIYRLHLCNLHDPAHCISDPQFMKQELELWAQGRKVVWKMEYMDTENEKKSEHVASTTLIRDRDASLPQVPRAAFNAAHPSTHLTLNVQPAQRSNQLQVPTPQQRPGYCSPYGAHAPSLSSTGYRNPPPPQPQRPSTTQPQHQSTNAESGEGTDADTGQSPHPLQPPKQELPDTASASAARHRAELASDPDALLYRYREYMAVFPLAVDERVNPYYTGLLANTLIARGDEDGELARGVGYAKRFYWRLYTRGDLALVLKLADEEKRGEVIWKW